MSGLPLAPGGFGLTCGALIAQEARLHPDRIAIREGETQRSYAELDARANALAHALLARGLVPGDTAAVLATNNAAYIEAQIAAGRTGIVLACQNWRLADDELAHCLGLVSPRLVLCDPDKRGRLAAVGLPGIETLAFGPDYEATIAGRPTREPGLEISPEAPFLVLYTSGTTGYPKGAVLSQRAMVARAMLSLIDGTQFPEANFIGWPPLFHMSGVDNVLGTLMTGGTVLVLEKFDAARIADILQTERIGLLSLVPATVEPLLEILKARKLRPAGVELVGSMADLVPRPLLAEITALLDAPYRDTFGSTEAGPAPASRGRVPVGRGPERLSKLQSSMTLVRLVDPEGGEVPQGTPGEVWVKGPTLFSGYWNDPEATRESLVDGWYRTGDVMVRNSDGSLDFVDRRKYLIKSGGENIYPAEIERVLLGLPGVLDAVVVRFPDARWGEVPALFVVSGDPGLDAETLTAALRARIAPFKVPKIVRFCAEADIPRSSTGKVKRDLLEKRLLAEIAAAPHA